MISNTPILLLFCLSLLVLSATAFPSPGAYGGGPTYTWSNPPPADGSKVGNNNGNQITGFSFAKWVDDVQQGKGMTPEQALASYKASEHAKREAGNNNNDDDDNDDELPPWYFTYGPGGGGGRNDTTTTIVGKRASEPTGPTCYWHKNERPKVEDAFFVVTMMAHRPELISIHKDEGRDVARPINTASINVRSVTGLRYAVLGTDIARAGGLIMDYCTWKGRSGGGEYAWGNGYLYVTIEHTGRGEKTMQENLMDKREQLIGPKKAEEEDEVKLKWQMVVRERK
ncbi:hypothetical protein NEUTE1DRAFT_68937 [Neurospora tetrasperma FGSC 2508]|uniref:Ecp2 effector protein domain-containing protein n=1 Tax=Neurospora tetrasperma (strain FGSC 2508 / ATCC MYA-4615 / P0657) TaxID=510951 RepID=F8MX95_NEUT8|nr:uncharacterized protein NEUTE1DRAFT_68937 [Neurospora tetrasperma FGSC 2508]EGO54366.1 hypothetical protein NEUTE1DRAFT_68937 [Neurospora tetrasperma FGSC 2508]EGZ68193.1 hypothetical protein NEUTE2DRAFT_160612 [Neurospora tetrasperma FGSC 2509]